MFVRPQGHHLAEKHRIQTMKTTFNLLGLTHMLRNHLVTPLAYKLIPLLLKQTLL